MTLVHETIQRLREASVPRRLLPDGRQLWLYQMLFTLRLVIGRADDDGYDNAWCFDSPLLATHAFLTWNPLNPDTPEPSGWIKNPVTGERRPSLIGGSDADTA